MSKVAVAVIQQNSFYWSLEPVIFSLKCLGIQSDLYLHSKKPNKLFDIFLGIMVFLFLVYKVVINVCFSTLQISGWISTTDYQGKRFA